MVLNSIIARKLTADTSLYLAISLLKYSTLFTSRNIKCNAFLTIACVSEINVNGMIPPENQLFTKSSAMPYDHLSSRLHIELV